MRACGQISWVGFERSFRFLRHRAGECAALGEERPINLRDANRDGERRGECARPYGSSQSHREEPPVVPSGVLRFYHANSSRDALNRTHIFRDFLRRIFVPLGRIRSGFAGADGHLRPQLNRLRPSRRPPNRRAIPSLLRTRPLNSFDKSFSG